MILSDSKTMRYGVVYRRKGENMTSVVSVRLDDDVKAELDVLVSELGMSMSSFFSIYAKQALREKGIPFRVTAEKDWGSPNHLTYTDPHDERLIELVLSRVHNRENREYIPAQEAFADLLGQE